MTNKQPVEFTKQTSLGSERVGNEVQIAFGDNIIDNDNRLPVETSQNAVVPSNFVYEFLSWVSGPKSATTNNWDMNTNSGTGVPAPSIFEYTVATGQTFKWSRVNMELVDGSMQVNKFGGIATLANGCLFQVIDTDGTTVLEHFGTDLQPIQRNADLSVLAGVDSVIQPAAGDDMLPIRFTIAKAGAPMELSAGQIIRWINQDNISGLTVFRMMIQGTLL